MRLVRLSMHGRRSLPDWSAVPGNSAEDRLFRNLRLAYFGKAHAILSLAFYALNTAIIAAQEGWLGLSGRVVDPADVGHMAAIALAATQWLLCHRGRRGPRALDVIDAGGLPLMMLGYAMSPLVHRSSEAVLVAVMAAQAIVTLRAIVIPGTARRTLWISAVSCLPAVAVSYHVTGSLGGACYILLWCGLIVAISTLASRIIYGLRERARDAAEIGQYRLEEKIGEGGMGTVYRASHALLRRPTAIKLLPRDRAGERNLARFEREVQQTSRLTHPNTVAIYDYGHTADGVFYYAMEFLDGLSLEELVQHHGAQPAGRVVHIVRQLCGALAEAHAHGLIHRDVKPANVLLCVRGDIPDFVKVLDFGLVKELAGGAPDVTAADSILGTPLYMSPEAIKDPSGVTDRADLYAVGALAYFLVTGSPPFTARTPVEVFSKHLFSEPEPPSARLGEPVPASLEALILRCLDKEPGSRPSASELARLLAAPGGVAPWTDADAARWWSEHGTRAARRTARSSGAHTVAIDVRERAADQSAG